MMSLLRSDTLTLGLIVLDLDPHRIGGDGNVPGQTVQRSLGNIDIISHECGREPDFDLFGDGLHASDAPSGGLRRVFLDIAFHVTGERDDTGFCRNADIGGGYAGFPTQFGKNGLL
jgi:hypothetical protein